MASCASAGPATRGGGGWRPVVSTIRDGENRSSSLAVRIKKLNLNSAECLLLRSPGRPIELRYDVVEVMTSRTARLWFSTARFEEKPTA